MTDTTGLRLGVPVHATQGSIAVFPFPALLLTLVVACSFSEQTPFSFCSVRVVYTVSSCRLCYINPARGLLRRAHECRTVFPYHVRIIAFVCVWFRLVSSRLVQYQLRGIAGASSRPCAYGFAFPRDRGPALALRPSSELTQLGLPTYATVEREMVRENEISGTKSELR